MTTNTYRHRHPDPEDVITTELTEIRSELARITEEAERRSEPLRVCRRDLLAEVDADPDITFVGIQRRLSVTRVRSNVWRGATPMTGRPGRTAGLPAAAQELADDISAGYNDLLVRIPPAVNAAEVAVKAADLSELIDELTTVDGGVS